VPEHDCARCNLRNGRLSPHNGKICLGCGSALATCRKPKPKASKPKCPQCGSGNCPPLKWDPTRLNCQACEAVFEPPDGYAVDTRPEFHAMKRESMAHRRLKP